MKNMFFILSVLVLTFTSCTKENENGLNKIGCECNDGTKIPSLDPSECSKTITVKESVLVRDRNGNPIYPTTYVDVVRTKTYGGFKQFLYGKGTFCDNYGNSIFCLGRNY